MLIHPVNGVVLLAYLAATLALGAWWARGQHTAEQYLVGGRSLPWWAVLGSIVASETSTITFLSIPGLAYARGGDLRFLQLALGFVVARILIAIFLVPLYFRGKLLSAYEVLRFRFGAGAERYATWLFLFARNVGDGLRLFLTASVLQMSFGSEAPLSWFILILAAVTIAYTWMGGIRSVVWNDCLQLSDLLDRRTRHRLDYLAASPWRLERRVAVC